MIEPVTLIAGGATHSGWTSVSVTRALENFAGAFEIGLTERWPGQSERRPISPGAECTLRLGNDVVITGYVDDAAPAIDADSRSVTVGGRDRAGDLVDCSADSKPGEWADQSLVKIAGDLARPFGIAVSALVDTGKPFASFRIAEGETAYEAIERACRARAVLATSDGLGRLVLTNAAVASDTGQALVEGGNVKAASGRFSFKDRFSKYVVKGHADEISGISAEEIAGPVGESTDPAVKRYRPLTVIAEDTGDNVSFKDRAVWESVTRAGRAQQADITVAGWRDAVGALWRPNTLVSCKLPSLGLDARMLVTRVTLARSDNEGSTATLTVAHPDAFKLIALADDKEDGGGLGW